MRYPHNTSSLHANSIITTITLNDDDDDDYYCNKIKQCPIMIILLIFFIKKRIFQNINMFLIEILQTLFTCFYFLRFRYHNFPFPYICVSSSFISFYCDDLSYFL